MMKTLVLFTTLLSLQVQAQGPGPKFFRVTTDASFTCSVAGATCAWPRNQFGVVSADGSAISEVLLNSVKSFEQPAVDKLFVNNCLDSDCLVICQAFCDCEENGAPCEETTAPPTPSPTSAEANNTPEPTVPDCPEKTDTSQCPFLMSIRLAGQGENCPCINFCEGAFLSCCETDGQCGSLSCPTQEAGTLAGYVFGCTEAEHGVTPAPDTASQTSIVIASLLAVSISLLYI